MSAQNLMSIIPLWQFTVSNHLPDSRYLGVVLSFYRGRQLETYGYNDYWTNRIMYLIDWIFNAVNIKV